MSWLLRAHHVADREGETRILAQGTAQALLAAAILWLLYLALEPYVRRFWPHTIISWTRLLGGAVQDPLVGRDALVGAVWAPASGSCDPCRRSCRNGSVTAPRRPWIKYLDGFLGPSFVLRVIVAFPLNAIGLAVAALLLLMLLKMLLRRERWAALALAILLTALQAIEQGAQGDAPWWLNLTVAAAIMSTFTALLLRFGLLSAVVGLTVANMLLVFHLSTDFSSWRSGPTVDVLIVLVALVGLAFRAAQRPVRSAVVVAAT